MRDVPDHQLAQEALETVDFVVSAQVVPPLDLPYVDALLPIATWGEVEGTYVNMEGRLAIGAAGVQSPGQARPTKAYVANWNRLFRLEFDTEALWDPFDMADGDLMVHGALPDSKVNPLTRPELSISEGNWQVIEGDWVMENGLPSEVLMPREMEFVARVHPSEAEALGIAATGGFVQALTQDGSVLLGVRGDAAIPVRTLWIPRASRHDWALHVQGLTGLARAEEVPSI
jgi:NADH-quinone oxidoreductase subunit G